jgi:hypothetical protein
VDFGVPWRLRPGPLDAAGRDAGFDTRIHQNAMAPFTKSPISAGAAKFSRRAYSRSGRAASGAPAWRSKAMHTETAENIQRRIVELRTEHRDLDLAIDALTANPLHDELQLKRLKKRKLLLKDQVTFLEHQLTPDIPA